MSSVSRLSHVLSSPWVVLLLLSMISVSDQTESRIQPGPVASNVDASNKDTHTFKAYGVDISWPMQHDTENHRYKNYMNGCYQQGYSDYEKRADGLYKKKDEESIGKKEFSKEYFIACNHAEQDRLEMNLNQPKEMQNYTHAGYAKVYTPSKVINLLKKFWTENEGYLWPEFWDDGNTYVNHWKAPTSLLDIGRQDLPYSFTSQEYNTIVQAIQDMLESWTNQRLVLTSAYGIRVYGEGAILAPHVDRLPLVSSAIINVFQHNVSEPWVLEVIGHDGMAHNLTSQPGDMILYESSSIIHGRPYPLKGEGAMYGSLFVHFEPLFHTLRHARKTNDHYASATIKDGNLHSKSAFEKALEEQLKKPTLGDLRNSAESGKIDKDEKANVGDSGTSVPGSAAFRKNPAYVWPEYYGLYDQRFDFEYNELVNPKPLKSVFGNLNSHQAASLGELDALKEVAKTQGRSQLFKADHNGWRPIHEAARSGHHDVVEYLLKEGAKVNERTNFNEGGNALYWAQKDPKKNAKTIAVLKEYGGVALSPFNKKTEAIKKTSVTKDMKENGKDKNDSNEQTM